MGAEEEGPPWEAGMMLGLAEGGLAPSRQGYIEHRALGKCSLPGARC